MTDPRAQTDRYSALRELGLRVLDATCTVSPRYVLEADDLLKVLEQAPVEHLMQTPLGWSTLYANDRLCTHTGRLIGIKPLAVADKKQDEIGKRIAEINRLSKEIEVLIEND